MNKQSDKQLQKKFGGITLLSLQIIILIIVFCCALVAFIFIAEMIFKNHKTAFDLKVFTYLSAYKTDEATRVMNFFTFFGAHKFLIPANILLIAAFIFFKKNKWQSINIPVISISSLLLMFTLKYIFQRHRPLGPLLEEARGYSFPSGHALMSFTFYGLVIYLVWLHVKNTWLKWTLVIMLALLILTIGLSRIYLRVHYVSDVIAGYCVGFMWLTLSLWILKKVEKYNTQKQEVALQSEAD